MALKRSMLKAMGIEDEKADEIIAAHVETVESLKADISKYKKDSESLEAVKAELEELKSKGDNGYKQKYEKEHEELEQLRTDVAAKETAAKKHDAMLEVLKESNVSEKRREAVLRLYDMNSVELDENGKIKDADKHKNILKNDWSDYIETVTTNGAPTLTPPAQSNAITKEQFAKMSYKERAKLFEENHELYEKMTE